MCSRAAYSFITAIRHLSEVGSNEHGGTVNSVYVCVNILYMYIHTSCMVVVSLFTSSTSQIHARITTWYTSAWKQNCSLKLNIWPLTEYRSEHPDLNNPLWFQIPLNDMFGYSTELRSGTEVNSPAPQPARRTKMSLSNMFDAVKL